MQELTKIQIIAISIIPVLFAITVHEVAHGWVASKFGDQTAKLSGRLTLNPIKHIDLVGTILVPIVMIFLGGFIFGWAKPVPVDARNMHNPRRDTAIVALAGPASNFLMAIFWAGIMKLGFLMLSMGNWISDYLINEFLINMGRVGIAVNLMIGILNCIPIPPLDGSHVLSSLLPPRAAWYFYRLEPYGFFILILLLVTGILNPVLAFLFQGTAYLVTSLFGLS